MKTGPMLRCESSPISAALWLESISAVTPHKYGSQLSLDAHQYEKASPGLVPSALTRLAAMVRGRAFPRLYILSSLAIQPGDIIHFEYRATPAEREGELLGSGLRDGRNPVVACVRKSQMRFLRKHLCAPRTSVATYKEPYER